MITKKLYSLVNGLMGRTSENPMPKGESDDQLEENFVDFFMEKIKKICDSLHDYDVYKPCFSESNKFSEFVPLSEQEVAALLEKWPVSHVRLTLSLLLYLRKYYQV